MSSRLLALFVLLASSTAARADHPRPPGSKDLTTGDDLDGLPEPLPGSGCFTVGAQRLHEAADAYRARFRRPQDAALITEQVNGLDLTDSARAIGYLKRSLGHKPPTTWQRAVEASCTRVVCALQKTLGDLESALWFLVAAAEVDAPPSLDQTPYEADSMWEQHELRGLARALLESPPELKGHVPTLKAWRRAPSGQTLKKGAAYNAVSYPKDSELFGLGTIVIRDTVWKFPQRDVRAVVEHELGHQWEFSRGTAKQHNPVSLSDDWLSLSGWRSKGGHGLKDYSLPPGVQIGTAFETTPGEDFADSVANYRFLPRLLRHYSQAKYDFIRKHFGAEHDKPAADEAIDAAFASIGGPLKALRECTAFIQRATFAAPKMHQVELYVVIPKAKGTHWEPVPRTTFVVHAGCVDKAMAALAQTPAWSKVLCRHDPEDVAVAVADRLEDAWASFAEGADKIRAAVAPAVAEGCVSKHDLTQRCFDGPSGLTIARREAERILEEQNGDKSDELELAHELLVQTPLIPSDEELKSRFPALHSGQDLMFACLKGVVEISPKSDPDKHWVYWVELPPTNERRGFRDPLWNAACQRDFAAHLESAGFKLDANDKLTEHLGYLLKNQAAPLVSQLVQQILNETPALRSHCHVPASGALSGNADCARSWLKPRVESLAPGPLVDQLTQHLVGSLKAR